jgi:hypothetical protein
MRKGRKGSEGRGVLKEREREFHTTEKGKRYIGDKQTNRERE